MPDGSSSFDNGPRYNGSDRPFIRPSHEITSPEELQTFSRNALTLPRRISTDETPRKLGSFLIDTGYITGIKPWHSWGFGYHSGDKTIQIGDIPMSQDNYDYFVFHLGTLPGTNEQLQPKSSETDRYRFLHEVNHAYQQYLEDKESPDDPGLWHSRVLKGAINSNLAQLFRYAYYQRNDHPGKGLTAWGNQLDYDHYTPEVQLLVRSIEDANELVTMQLWHPAYLQEYGAYISGQNPHYGPRYVESDRLTQLPQSDVQSLTRVVTNYMQQMRHDIK